MQAGQLYEYDISLFPGIWMRWLTEIRQVRFREFFADEQRFGPYRFFYHSHHFEPVDGGVKMIDHIVYDVGYGPLGWVLNKLLVRRKLNQIFTYRRHRISEIFPKPS